jgi:hypothetical protein
MHRKNGLVEKAGGRLDNGPGTDFMKLQCSQKVYGQILFIFKLGTPFYTYKRLGMYIRLFVLAVCTG